MRPHPIRHVTHAALALLVLAVVWILVHMNDLPHGTLLLVSAIVYGLSCAAALCAVFCMPELPRLKREKGRTPPHCEMWAALLFFVASGVMLLLDVSAFEAQQPIRYAAANAALSAFAACVSVASERMRVCWNDEGFVLRTALGRLHCFRWEQLTGYDTYRGVARLRVAGKSYAVNLGSKQAVSFLRALRER